MSAVMSTAELNMMAFSARFLVSGIMPFSSSLFARPFMSTLSGIHVSESTFLIDSKAYAPSAFNPSKAYSFMPTL